MDATLWIEHLNQPLPLAGFALFVLAGLVWLFKPEKLNSKATERLMNKGIILVFIMGLLIVLFVFSSHFMQNSASSTPASTVKQTITNSTGVQTQAGHDNTTNVGDGTLAQHGNTITDTAPPTNLEQEIRDNNGGVQTQAGRNNNTQTPTHGK